MQTVAEHLADALVRAGIHTAFGIPGGETLTLLDALRRAGLRFVLARHETGAGLMAEGLHQVTGAPGLLVATIGPGVANCVNAVAHARLDRVPLVVVTGNVATSHGPAFTHQVLDHRALLAPVVKAGLRLAPDTAARDIARALALAVEGRPGPVHLDLPLDVAEAPCGDEASPVAPPAEPPLEDLTALAARLGAARRPLVLVGLEAARAPSVERLVQRLGAPALATYKAIGAIPHAHPRWLSAVGLSPRADDLVLPLVRDADAVVLAGYDAVEMRAGWLEPFDPDALVVDVSISPAPPPEHRTDVRLVGPVDRTLAALAAAIAPHDRPGWDARAAAVGRELRAAFAPSGAWGPAGIVTALGEAVTPGTVVTVDTGAHRILASQMWRAEEPGRLLQSNGLCTMGYAVPAAIGAALGGGRAVALVGDGGFEMAPGELATARDLGVDVTIVVIDDRSLALIEKKQRARGLPSWGVDFGADETFAGTDYVRLAEAFGAEARRFDDPASLREWLRAPHRGIRLAHCPIDRKSYDSQI